MQTYNRQIEGVWNKKVVFFNLVNPRGKMEKIVYL